MVIEEVEMMPVDPPNMVAVRAYFSDLQIQLARRMSDIETFLGFVESSEALAVRVSKIEAFLGVK